MEGVPRDHGLGGLLHTRHVSALQAADFVTNCCGRWVSPHGDRCLEALAEAGWTTYIHL